MKNTVFRFLLPSIVLAIPACGDINQPKSMPKILSVIDAFGSTEVPLAGESISTAARFEPQTVRPDAFSPPWLSKGKILIFNFQGSLEFAPPTYVYSYQASRGENRITINGNPEAVIGIIRHEFPEGRSIDFIKKHLLVLLTGFHLLEKPIDEGRKKLTIEMAEPAIQNDFALARQLDDFLELPKIVIVGENRWKVQYLSFGGDTARFSLNFIEGTLKPFDITQPLFAFSERVTGYLMLDQLKEFVAAKECAIKHESADNIKK